MIKFLKYLCGYTACAAIVVGVVHLDRTTDRFDRIRDLIGIERPARSTITSAPTMSAVAMAVLAGDLEVGEAEDVMFGMRRWPDYRSALPDAPDGWTREMPFRMDDSEVVAFQARMGPELVAAMGLASTAMASLREFSAMPGEMVAQLQQGMDELDDAMSAALVAGLTPNAEGAKGSMAYKASGAIYRREDREILVAINKLWRSSFEGINGLAQTLDQMAGDAMQVVTINGYEFRVTRIGRYTELEHKVDWDARVLVSGLAPAEELIALALEIDLDAIHQFHRGQSAERPSVASRLPQMH